MKYTKSEEVVYTTTDYDGFIFTDWNRNVSNARVVKMVESIKKVGWLPEPVMVNEKFEVIDGQSRVKALEKLGMPVQFCVRKGVGRAECQALNLFQKNWTTMDYINSYVADGNNTYIWLKEMMSKYKTLSTVVILQCAGGKGRNTRGGGYVDAIVNNCLDLSPAEKALIDDELFFFSRLVDTAKYIGGRTDVFFQAVSFLYWLNDINNERLCNSINNARYDGLVCSGNVEGWLTQMEVLYNKQLTKKNRIDIMHEYKMAE